MMIKVLFVCLGNVCRSPMAEFIFKNMLRKEYLEDCFLVESKATNTWGIGNPVNPDAREKLLSVGIDPGRKRSSLLKKEDYGKYDYIIGMDDSNIRDMKRILGGDPEKKIYKLLSFADDPGDVADPYYTENFDICYDDIMRGLGGFLEHCKKRFKM